MENQGYVGEQSRLKEQSTLKYRYSDQLCEDAISDDSFVARTTKYLEGHVYEDIFTSTETSSALPKLTASEAGSTHGTVRDSGLPANFAKRPWVHGASSTTTTTPLTSQQNSAFSSTAGISANHDSTSSSSRTVSKTSEDEGSCANPSEVSKVLYKNVEERVSSSLGSRDGIPCRDPMAQFDYRPNRRRKKKDCKRCRSKLEGAETGAKLGVSKDDLLREIGNHHREKNPDALLFRDSILKPQKIYPILNRTNPRDLGTKRSCSAVIPMYENESLLVKSTAKPLGSTLSDKTLEINRSKLLEASKNGADMRINSIYSQDRWFGKDTSIFRPDFKGQNLPQKIYSLPVQTHSPTSQNRVNLRRSVRNDPPPHPARLDKHRRGWTLHLVHPLKKSGCSCSLVPLLIVVLILLGVAGVALYIFFQPEKLQIIQQYLTSSSDELATQNVTCMEETYTPAILNDELNLENTTTTSATVTTMRTSVDSITMSNFFDGSSSFLETLSPSIDMEHSNQTTNTTRYCDECFEDEVCVALVDEEVPMCRIPRDREDPTGCAGLCAFNKQKCHRLDVDAFRCVEMKHYCLENEWTCSNTLCIPIEKHCDGHMNCYDHSDEYDCDCNLETHFQCGNETSCLLLNKRCDGQIDCWDASDEFNCTLACPLENEFTCNNGECILKDRFCDGLADCNDGSDEPHGCQGKCNKHEFTCQNGRCITKSMKCNGIDDCGDGTDERYCKNRLI